MPAIATKSLSVWFHGTPALREVELACPAGQTTAVLGGAGSGKTTLLRCFNGLNVETQGFHQTGSVRVSGVEVSYGPADLAGLRRRVGMVFPGPTPFALSIFDNVAFGLQLDPRVLADQIDGRAERALRLVGLWAAVRDRLEAPASSLTAGEQQMLCLARALALEPDVLLLDEPMSQLYPEEAAWMEDVISQLRGEITVVLATPDTRTAGRLADFTIMLSEGAVAEAAPTEELFTTPRSPVTQAFLSRRFRT